MRRSLRILAIAVAVIAVITLLFVAVPAPRSWAVRVALQIVLAQRGYHFTAGSFFAGKTELDATDLSITDRSGAPLFTAKRVVIDYDAGGLFGRGDRAYGIRSIIVTAPVVSIVRHTDGTFNFTSLIAGFGGAGSSAGRPPYRFTFALRDGRMTFANPTAYSPLGRRFAVNALTANEPADSPPMVTFFGSPPNAAIFRSTHWSAATWSSMP